MVNKSADQRNKVIICKLFHCRCAADDWRSRQDQGFPKPPRSGLASHFLPRTWHSLHTTHPLFFMGSWKRGSTISTLTLLFMCGIYGDLVLSTVDDFSGGPRPTDWGCRRVVCEAAMVVDRWSWRSQTRAPLGRWALQTRPPNGFCRAQAALHCRPGLPTMEPTTEHPPRSSDQQFFCWTKKNITEGTQQEMITESTLNITYEKVWV